MYRLEDEGKCSKKGLYMPQNENACLAIAGQAFYREVLTIGLETLCDGFEPSPTDRFGVMEFLAYGEGLPSSPY